MEVRLFFTDIYYKIKDLLFDLALIAWSYKRRKARESNAKKRDTKARQRNRHIWKGK